MGNVREAEASGDPRREMRDQDRSARRSSEVDYGVLPSAVAAAICSVRRSVGSSGPLISVI